MERYPHWLVKSLFCTLFFSQPFNVSSSIVIVFPFGDCDWCWCFNTWRHYSKMLPLFTVWVYAFKCLRIGRLTTWIRHKRAAIDLGPNKTPSSMRFTSIFSGTTEVLTNFQVIFGWKNLIQPYLKLNWCCSYMKTSFDLIVFQQKQIIQLKFEVEIWNVCFQWYILENRILKPTSARVCANISNCEKQFTFLNSNNILHQLCNSFPDQNNHIFSPSLENLADKSIDTHNQFAIDALTTLIFSF